MISTHQLLLFCDYLSITNALQYAYQFIRISKCFNNRFSGVTKFRSGTATSSDTRCYSGLYVCGIKMPVFKLTIEKCLFRYIKIIMTRIYRFT